MEEKRKEAPPEAELPESGSEQGDSGQCGPEQKNGSCKETAHADFSDPVYKEISLANGTINRMNREELRAKCAELKLDTRGVKDVLKKRLKNYYKKQKLKQSATVGSEGSYYDYICVVDFEATCEENNPRHFIHEIIEFPVVLIDTHTLEIVDSFQEYVKPQLNPQLSDFCVELTGITQKMVDEADPFPRVLRRVVAWLQEKELGTKYKYTLLTDGSWDMSKFLYTQCRLSRLRYPQFARNWINIRKSYGNYYKVARTQTRLNCMLENLGMQYEGRLHCGLDDSRNIARVAIRMLKDGCRLRVNERLHEGELQNVSSTAGLEGAPPPQYPKSRD
ncbi:3'-5' exoribonuclease 1 [Pangasianodon hypophthalmus]|uniref:3'-5' exoribonuclease 1 n=1 Tax=Pangasianodon hypophthalmus TaxID=310915 RepID=UPI002307BC7E|nr:3'-5' exoribonuclease 1 [Pangasianodon hypophthalmus]XP_026796871.2 3'-5' exoribonuclease 1 [Pangasianodon hypophthalmus]